MSMSEEYLKAIFYVVAFNDLDLLRYISMKGGCVKKRMIMLEIKIKAVL